MKQTTINTILYHGQSFSLFMMEFLGFRIKRNIHSLTAPSVAKPNRRATRFKTDSSCHCRARDAFPLESLKNHHSWQLFSNALIFILSFWTEHGMALCGKQLRPKLATRVDEYFHAELVLWINSLRSKTPIIPWGRTGACAMHGTRQKHLVYSNGLLSCF